MAGKKQSVVDCGDAIDDERGASFASFQNVRWTPFIEKATKPVGRTNFRESRGNFEFVLKETQSPTFFLVVDCKTANKNYATTTISA